MIENQIRKFMTSLTIYLCELFKARAFELQAMTVPAQLVHWFETFVGGGRSPGQADRLRDRLPDPGRDLRQGLHPHR